MPNNLRLNGAFWGMIDLQIDRTGITDVVTVYARPATKQVWQPVITFMPEGPTGLRFQRRTRANPDYGYQIRETSEGLTGAPQDEGPPRETRDGPAIRAGTVGED